MGLGGTGYHQLDGKRTTQEVRMRRRDADGREAEAIAVIRANPDLALRKVVERLKSVGIKRSFSRAHVKRVEIFGPGARAALPLWYGSPD